MTAAQAGAPTAPASASEIHAHVTCPFCGLRCDDLEIERKDRSLTITRNGCTKAKAGFERPLKPAQPRVAGKPVALSEAIAAAAALIKGARLPAFGGLATDVDGMRSIMSIADKARGVVDHAYSEAQGRNLKVLQTSGYFMTTMTEARNRADLFIIASDVHTFHPRFFERVVCNEKSMFADPAPKRTVVFLGEGYDTSAAVGARIGDVVHIPCATDRIGEIVSALRSLHKGAPLPAESVAGIPKARIEDLLARCHKADYGVVVWVPPGLDFPNADLTVHQICEFVKDLNVKQRFAGLSLGGNEGASSAASVCAWQSGYPLRVSFETGAPKYDPDLYAIPKLIASKQTDCLVWLASFTADLSPPATDIPTVVLGCHDIKLTQEPAVYIPVGTPGIDHRGQLVRCDSVVSLPLRDLGRASGLPRTVDVLSAIEAAL
jgi:formylmethanofuran dehydrogenase subunit B